MFPAASPTSGSCRVFRKPLKDSCTPCDHPSLAVEHSDVKGCGCYFCSCWNQWELYHWRQWKQHRAQDIGSSRPATAINSKWEQPRWLPQECCWARESVTAALLSGVGLLGRWGSTDFGTVPTELHPVWKSQVRSSARCAQCCAQWGPWVIMSSCMHVFEMIYF